MHYIIHRSKIAHSQTVKEKLCISHCTVETLFNECRVSIALLQKQDTTKYVTYVTN